MTIMKKISTNFKLGVSHMSRGACGSRPVVRFTAALALSSVLVLGGCDSLDTLLSVDAPSRVVASDLNQPSAAGLLVSSVANELRCAAAWYAAASALTGMEWADASNNSVTNIWDSRNHDTSGYGAQYANADCGSSQPAVYKPLSRARWSADFTLGNLGEWSATDVPEKAAYTAEVSMYAGYAYTYFGEAMCSVAFDGGPEQTRADSWNLAVQRFDAAISGGSGDVQNAARVGKARALLNLGKKSDAASVASSVPAGFKYELQFSADASVTKNPLWLQNHDYNSVTIAETRKDQMVGGVADPRIAVSNSGVDHPTTGIRVWTADKFPAVNSTLELATWEEAQLIKAEAEHAAGNLAAAVAIINTLHTNAGLPAFASSDAQEVMDQIVYERSAEMFLEGHHLYDITRYNIPLVPAVGTYSPFGDTFGSDLCFKLPATEFQNNENIG